LFECQLVASGPVSASPSPITHATMQIRDCRTPHRKRATTNSRARRLRGSSPASPARRGSECRRERELLEKPPQPVDVFRHVRVILAYGTFEIRVRDQRSDRRAPARRCRSCRGQYLLMKRLRCA
jgi:hypothetical protein